MFSRVYTLTKTFGTASAYRNAKRQLSDVSKQSPKYPKETEVAIIGGGVIGASVAYWLKSRSLDTKVVVFEMDPTYCHASTVLSAGGLRQQFALPENIEMSQFGAEFLRNVKSNLGKDCDVQFAPHGYLVLANQENATDLEKNFKLQQDMGVNNELLSPEKLKQRYPWLNTEGVEVGCIGLENEGWFDPWSLLYGLRKKSIELGAEYIKGEVTGFTFKEHRDMIMEGMEPGTFVGLDDIVYKTEEGEEKYIKFAMCILAAGAQSGRIADMAGMGQGEGLLRIPLPVEPRKRYIFCVDCKDPKPPSINAPMICDTSGSWVRREGMGTSFICGRAPEPWKDGPCQDLDVDEQFFDQNVWPNLAYRIPAFENLKVKSSWAGHYEYNTFDENGIIGPHPYYHNLYFATGFSGHGLQHAPATGRAIAELIMDGRFTTIDLTRLGFDRLLTDKPMIESCIY